MSSPSAGTKIDLNQTMGSLLIAVVFGAVSVSFLCLNRLPAQSLAQLCFYLQISRHYVPSDLLLRMYFLTHESRVLKRFFKYVTYTNDRTFLKCFVGINTYYPSSPSALICFPAGGRTLVPNNSHLCLCLYSDEGLFQGPRYFLSSVSATDPLAHVSSTILAYSLYTHAIYVYLVIYFLNPVALLTSSWSIDERL